MYRRPSNVRGHQPHTVTSLVFVCFLSGGGGCLFGWLVGFLLLSLLCFWCRDFFQYKYIAVLNGFGSALGKFVSFCRLMLWTVTKPEPQVTWQQRLKKTYSLGVRPTEKHILVVWCVKSDSGSSINKNSMGKGKWSYNIYTRLQLTSTLKRQLDA